MTDIKTFAPDVHEPRDDDLICYCFQYTKKEIEADFLNNARHSTILERIAVEKKMGRCRCAEKNPRGR